MKYEDKVKVVSGAYVHTKVGMEGVVKQVHRDKAVVVFEIGGAKRQYAINKKDLEIIGGKKNDVGVDNDMFNTYKTKAEELGVKITRNMKEETIVKKLKAAEKKMAEQTENKMMKDLENK